MSDVEDPPTPTVAKLRRFYEARKVKLPCAACGENDFTVVDTPGMDAAYVLMNRNGSAVIPSPHVPVYLLLCNNCGLVRAHAKAAVEGAQS